MPSFYDGLKAKRHNVTTHVGLDGLHIDGPTLATSVVWQFDDLLVIARESDEGPWTLSSKAMKLSRLRVTEKQIFSALARRRPDLSQSRTRFQGLKLGLMVAAATASIVAGMIFVVPYMAGPIASAIPTTFESRFGKAIAHEAHVMLTNNEDDLSVCASPSGQQALDAIVTLFAQALDSPYRYDIRVVDTAQVNAYAAPGGWLIVTSGLIDSASGSSEVAGIIAHEMAHVELRHGLKSVITNQGRSILLTVLGGGGSGPVAEISAIAALNAGHSRAQEWEADHIALELLRRLDVSTAGMGAFFDRLAGDDTGHRGHYLDTHPDLGERADAAHNANPEGRNLVISDAQWQEIRKICDTKAAFRFE